MKDKDMLSEYDFSRGARGKYAKRYAKGSNIIILSPDVSVVFKDSTSVNEALRSLMKVASAAKKVSNRSNNKVLVKLRKTRRTA